MAFATALAMEPLYSTAEKNVRLRLILERIERSFKHKEPAVLSGAQIEHVMPQTLTPEWSQELGDAAEDQWSELLHTLGNLTLTKYNAEMSNKPYKDKQKALAGSHFVLNRYFAEVVQWSPDALRERGRLSSRSSPLPFGQTSDELSARRLKPKSKRASCPRKFDSVPWWYPSRIWKGMHLHQIVEEQFDAM